MGLFDKFKRKKELDGELTADSMETEEYPAVETDTDDVPDETPEMSEAFAESNEEADISSEDTPESAEEVPEDISEPEDEEDAPAKREGFFTKLKNGLKKTKDGFVNKVELLINSFTKIDEDFFDELEETLILSDIGAETSMEICDRLRAAVKRTGATDPADVKELLREIISEILTGENELRLDTKPSVIMVIGVNGAGKTTTIGKLAAHLKRSGKRVIVAAADTFRAAAIDQLNVWTDRAGVELIKQTEGSDPAAVVFDAINAAKARGADVVLCDTAGRLHNKKNLMEELRKMNRIIDKEYPNAHRENLIVLDGTTGQNAMVQAREFGQVAQLTGIVLTKMDGTAKGGIAVAIQSELQVPVKYIGVGETIEDLQKFDANDYVNALFDVGEESEEEKC